MASVESITFDCNDPSSLADFWADALDGQRAELPVSTDDVRVDLPGDGPDLLFRELSAGTKWRMPLHLDLSVEDRGAAVDRLRELGATVRETKTEEYDSATAEWTILEDPEENAFCVSEY